MENNLERLIADMQAQLHTEPYVFATVDDGIDIPMKHIHASFREAEGLTLILELAIAERYQIPYTYKAAWITLAVQSDLEAVGFTAYFSKLLAEAGISCNVLAAYHHDHIFVPWEKKEIAMEVLQL